MSVEFLDRTVGEAADRRMRSRAETDLSYASLAHLNRLREALVAAGGLLAACHRLAARSAGDAPLFFFDRAARSEHESSDLRPPAFPEAYFDRLADTMPGELLAWRRLPALLDDALTLLPASAAARRAARTLNGLAAAAAVVAPHLRPVREVAELLAVLDDQVVLAVHPASRFAVRVQVCGVADVRQLHVLLADLVPTDRVPGGRPDRRVVAAYRDVDPHPDAPLASARFQLYLPAALRPDGTLPCGLEGSDHWVWGDRSPAEIPAVNGERVLLLGDPVFADTWPAVRTCPRLRAEATRIETLSRPAVERWLGDRGVTLPVTGPLRMAA